MNAGSSKTRRSRLIANARRSVRGAALVSALLLFAIARSLSQETHSAQNPASVAGSPFADVNESISQTANAVLASATHPGAAGGARILADTSVTKSAIPSDVQFDPGPGLSLTNAPSRLASLRPVIEPILRQAGIPVDLVAVVLVESGGDPMALSPKGARGIWQLMPDTARRYGLTVDASEDDRLDIEKSTHVAARYLSDLYSEFGSWPLALAAYNTGEQNLQHAIARSRSTDFNVLSSLRLLPLETRNYVPAVLATATRLTNSPTEEQIPISWEPNARTVFAVAEGSN